jgi:hypothetical protein
VSKDLTKPPECSPYLSVNLSVMAIGEQPGQSCLIVSMVVLHLHIAVLSSHVTYETYPMAMVSNVELCICQSLKLGPRVRLVQQVEQPKKPLYAGGTLPPGSVVLGLLRYAEGYFSDTLLQNCSNHASPAVDLRGEPLTMELGGYDSRVER